MSTSGTHLSKEFFELIKAIGESKSKQEEDRIIQREVQTLKKKLESPSFKKSSATSYGLHGSGVGLGGPPGAPAANTALQNKKKAKEFLVRLLYVEMLGHDGSFGYIKAVELAASSSIMHKRTGYLVCSACLSPDHEFRFMLINQMQRDLNSSHVLETCAALLAIARLITSDMVPAVSSEVTKLLSHEKETVRKKAIITLHRLHQIAPDVVTKQEMLEKLRRVLCDRDPAVMGSSLNVIEAMATLDPMPFKDLVPSLVSILKQIIEHRLPSEYDYHRVPAPWMQMKLVRILAILGKNDANASNGTYEILSDCMKKADVGINAGYAVVYECVRTITSVYPNPTLLDSAAEAISRFIASRSYNLKYLGVTGLAAIVEGHPQYAARHQMAVIECLEDRDETLQRKTLDLLYRMTNPVNVEFITDKLLHFLGGTTDSYLKRDLTLRVCSVAERYAPNNAWYIRTITRLFEISGDMVRQDVAQNLMSLVAEGAGTDDDEDGDEEADMLLRQNAVEVYAQLLDRPPAKLPRILLETMAWCLGEYGYLSAEYGLEEILSKLCDLARTGKNRLRPETRRFLLSAIMKLVAQAGTCPPHAAHVIDDYTRSRDVDLQQRCLEFQNLLTSAPHMLGEVLPVDASLEDVDVDENLSFLDGFVQEAIRSGAKEYEKPEDDDDDDYLGGGALGNTKTASAFKMTPYEKPTATRAAGSFGTMRGMGSGGSSDGVTLPPGAGHATGGGSGPSQYGNLSSGPGAGGAMGGGGGGNGGGINPNTGEPSLVLKNVASVWGRGGLNVPSPASATIPAPSSAGGYGGGTGSFGGSGASSAAPSPAPSPWSQQPALPPAEEPPKPREVTEKERLAAALFGGIVPGAAPPPPAPAPAPPRRAVPPAAAAKPPVAAPPPPSAPPPAPASAPPPEIDLLDIGSFSSEPPSAPASAVGDTDFLTPTPLTDVSSPSLTEPEPPAPSPAPKPAAAAAAAVDPFAEVGLLDGVSDAPIASLSSSSSNRFEYSGVPMSPLPIDTAEFGRRWGACPATAPASVDRTNKVDTLDKFMDLCERIGAHKVESIAATNEGIAAGMISGGTMLALIHGKVTPLGGGASKVDVTIKSTDVTMGGCLAMFLQNMMR